MGRPSSYTPELVESICARLAEGEPMTVICRDEGMPAPRTVRDWEASMPEVSAAIARAREEGEYVMAEDCLQIADDGRRDYQVLDDGREVVDHDHIQRAKLRIDTRLKLLAKFNPKRWGDKIQHADADGGKIEPATFILQPVAPKHRED